MDVDTLQSIGLIAVSISVIVLWLTVMKRGGKR